MLILCKAWAPRRRLCDVQNGGSFCFPASHLVSIFVLEKQDFKKVMLILALLSWRKGICVCFFHSKKHRQSKQTADSLQLWMHGGLLSGMNGMHMLHLHMLLSSATLTLLSSACVCEWSREKSVFFVGVHLEGKGVVTAFRYAVFVSPLWNTQTYAQKHKHLSYYTSDDLRWQHLLF